MVLGLFKKRNPIKVEFCELPSDMIISEVNSLSKLRELDTNKHFFIETANEFYLVSKEGNIAFRYNKPSSQPRIIKVEKLELSPDSFGIKAELSQSMLFEFCKRQCLFLFETADGFFIPTGEVCFWAKKEKGG